MAIFNFTLRFGNLKTMRKVRAIYLSESGKLLAKNKKYLENISFPYNLKRVLKVLRRALCS